jgi:RimJ/RimL family protein N-acetyltransferase
MPQVSLRPIRISDAEICFRWISDPQVHRFLGVLQPARTLAQERSWIANILADKQQRAFIIEDEEGRPIGTCGLRGIDSERGTSFLGIMIGEKGLWDKGYGTAATTKLVEYAFGELGLREIRLSCHRENRRALRCYEKAGFRPSRRTPGRRGARPEDIHMSAGREAWLAGRRLDHDAEAAQELAGQEEARLHLNGREGRNSGESDG